MGYIGMCRCEGYGFQAVYSRIGYINQSVWVQNKVYSYSRIGGIWEFTLVQGSKIQLNQLWYRLRVPGSQRHIPTQKFLKYPPPPGTQTSCRLQFLYCVFPGLLGQFTLVTYPRQNSRKRLDKNRMRLCELLFENVSVSGALQDLAQDFVFSLQEEKFPISKQRCNIPLII